MNACREGHIEIVELMIEKGVNYEGTPIHLRHKEINKPKKIII